MRLSKGDNLILHTCGGDTHKGTLTELRALFWEWKGQEVQSCGANCLPQVPPPACASAIPRFVVLDAAFPDPVVTRVRVTLVSDSTPMALAA